MSSPRRQRTQTGRPWRRVAMWALLTLPVLLVAGWLIGRAWLEAYLKSDEFRRFVSRKTAETLRADGEFAPLHFTGLNVYADGFQAHGSEAAAFSSLGLDQLRAELSLRRWRERVWQIERVEAQRVEVRLEGSRITLPDAAIAPVGPPTATSKPRTDNGGWLPNRVEVGTAVIKEANVYWGDAVEGGGSLRGVAITATPFEDGWDIVGNSGHIEHLTLPGLDVSEVRVRYKPGTLFVQNAEFRQGATGSVHVEGEVKFNESVDLRTKLAGIDVLPLLSKDWRLRLHGQLGGEVRVQSTLPAGDAPVLSGTVQLSQGQLEALPVLDEIAAFTQLQQYRRLTLTRASADFRHERGTLRATNLVLESDGLIRIEGAFTVVNDTIDGSFQVGVTSSSLQWLPGSQERVFTQARGGYVWAPMRLNGPLAKPSEDLSPRLIAAAQGAVIDKATSTVNDAIQTGRDAVKGALDFFLPRPK